MFINISKFFIHAILLTFIPLASIICMNQAIDPSHCWSTHLTESGYEPAFWAFQLIWTVYSVALVDRLHS